MFIESPQFCGFDGSASQSVRSSVLLPMFMSFGMQLFTGAEVFGVRHRMLMVANASRSHTLGFEPAIADPVE
jgi:hypothetical protein